MLLIFNPTSLKFPAELIWSWQLLTVKVLFPSQAKQPASAGGNSQEVTEKSQGINMSAALSLGRRILRYILQDYWDGLQKDWVPEAHSGNGSFRPSVLLCLPLLSHFPIPSYIWDQIPNKLIEPKFLLQVIFQELIGRQLGDVMKAVNIMKAQTSTHDFSTML